MITAAEHRASTAKAMSEDALLAQVRRLATDLGWMTYHTHDSRRSESGFPDLVLVHPRQGRILFRELKRMTGRVSADQKTFLDALQAVGQDAGVWRPDDLLEERILAELLPPTSAPEPAATEPEAFTWQGAPATPTCGSCRRERTTNDWYDYNPIQAVTGRPLGWYNGDDGQTCGQCLTAMMAGAWPAGARGNTP